MKVLIFALLMTIAADGSIVQNGSTFEVASVKRNNRQDGAFVISGTPNGFTATNVALERIIAFAYNEPITRIVGGPNWIKSDPYDVVARAEGASNTQIRLMLQSLLADRFQLKLHRETRDLEALVVIVGKN